MNYREKMYETILLSIEDHIATVQFNRPRALNSLNLEMGDELNEILAAMSGDPDVRVVILTGGEKVFCAGGDLAEFVDFGIIEARDRAERIIVVERLLSEFPKPTIAAIAGAALGGGMEFVLMCDLRIAAENAKFGQLEVNVGITPVAGATQRLVQNISLCKAKELIFLGEIISAQEANDLGFINKVVSLADLMSTARDWAKKLASKPPVALRMAKMVINSAWNCDIETGMKLEVDAWSILYGTEDQKEGMKAFLEKRRPVFRGK